MQPMLNMAVKAARRAGAVINRASFDLEQIKVDTKGVNELVTDIDRAAEDAIREVLLTAYPTHAVLAEESSPTVSDPDAEYVWIIDPIDGTTNFVHGFPEYCVSIALQVAGTVQLGVVYDPVRNDLYTAIKGSGAQLNNRRIRVSRADRLNRALLGTGFANRNRSPEELAEFLKMFEVMLTNAQALRRPGSAVLDLAHVACGRYDGFFEKNLKPWDIAAGALLVSEAGGIVSDFSGEGDYLKTGSIIAGTPRIFPQMLKLLQPFK